MDRSYVAVLFFFSPQHKMKSKRREKQKCTHYWVDLLDLCFCFSHKHPSVYCLYSVPPLCLDFFSYSILSISFFTPSFPVSNHIFPPSAVILIFLSFSKENHWYSSCTCYSFCALWMNWPFQNWPHWETDKWVSAQRLIPNPLRLVLPAEGDWYLHLLKTNHQRCPQWPKAHSVTTFPLSCPPPFSVSLSCWPCCSPLVIIYSSGPQTWRSNIHAFLSWFCLVHSYCMLMVGGCCCFNMLHSSAAWLNSAGRERKAGWLGRATEGWRGDFDA